METKSGRRTPQDAGMFMSKFVRTMKNARQAFENRLFVEPSSWAPPHQAWQQRAQSTRELAELAKDGQAKNLLTLIAETYDRLARPL